LGVGSLLKYFSPWLTLTIHLRCSPSRTLPIGNTHPLFLGGGGGSRSPKLMRGLYYDLDGLRVDFRLVRGSPVNQAESLVFFIPTPNSQHPGAPSNLPHSSLSWFRLTIIPHDNLNGKVRNNKKYNFVREVNKE
jgi:hypothetical protein